jgi:heme-degrading monooxygenase HmoA
MHGQSSTEIIAALTLARYPWRNVYSALVAMGLNRLWLRQTPGLRFWKLLGSARGRGYGAWEPRRYGLFSVWESAAALDAFEHRSPVMAAYRRRADEVWTVRLAPLRWHGIWGGADPFAGARPAEPPTSGPVAILTRATIRLHYLRAFRSAARPVTADLARHPGLIASIGLGETPLRAQATFSLWSDLRATHAFAYTGAEHTAVIRHTREEGWYSEELFARFRPIRSYGAWDGSDPLAAIAESPE